MGGIHNKKYVVSTGADYNRATGRAYPGFSIYHEGPDLVAVVSTGEEVWELKVTGQLYNDSWTNIGIRWSKPDLSDKTTPVLQLGGLELYINQERVGQVLLPEYTEAGLATFEPVLDYKINGQDPPVIMMGCHFDHESQAFSGHSGGEYDEAALWNKELVVNDTIDETVFFLGAYGNIFLLKLC
jgi:hypothetical protein